MGDTETDALAQFGGAGESYSELTELHGGFIDATTGKSTDDNATDHYGVFGRAIIKDAETEDRVYVNNLEVTGGVKQAVWDENVAWNPFSGHGFQLYNASFEDKKLSIMHAANDNQYINIKLALIKVV